MESKELSVLLVEDEFLIALDAEQILKNFGATNVMVISTYEHAEQYVQDRQFDVAVLDVNLNGRLSLPIAHLIKQRGIPVILATGYELRERQLSGLEGVPCIAKPYSPERLVEALRSALKNKNLR